ncbi:hypothetical protein ACC691_38160, partial [Rhizobium johnstonii]|uniref:hypothetical protein n=1 Tax=Rhizobium johnstonii TaxID=3019933 RepID=UPI003F9AD6FF
SLCARGDPLVLFQAALDLDDRTGAVLHRAQTLAAMANHIRSREPRSSSASEYAARAQAIAQPASLVRVLRSLGEDSATASPDGLTAREIEVLGPRIR